MESSPFNEPDGKKVPTPFLPSIPLLLHESAHYSAEVAGTSARGILREPFQPEDLIRRIQPLLSDPSGESEH